MKQKKAPFKKYNRKYLFLQNSLLSFLYWRVSEKSDFRDFRHNIKKSIYINHKNSLHFLEQEKISFQNYWKHSESKKVENIFEHMNREFILVNNIEFKNTSKVPKKKNLFCVFKNSQNQKSEFSYKNKKMLRSFLFEQSPKQFSAFFHRFKLPKKTNKLKKLQLLNTQNLKAFIPKSDCVQKKNIYSVDQKLSEFFPKKKNFIQYWIFPLFGFVIYFSSNPGFSDTKCKQIIGKTLSSQSNLQSPAFSSFVPKFKNLSIFQKPFDNKFYPYFFPLNSIEHKTKLFLEMKSKEQNLKSILNFSYTNEFSKEIYKQIQNRENNEFESYSDFSFKIFQNSPQFLFNSINTLTSTNKKEIEPFFYFYNKKLLRKNIYKKIIETKRNTFHWKWFSLNEQSLNRSFSLEQKKNLSFFYFKIPSKAQFFNPIFENHFLIELPKLQTQFLFDSFLNFNLKHSPQIFKDFSTTIDKKNFSYTPLLNFSKTIFFYNDFERYLNNLFHFYFSKKIDQHNTIVNFSSEDFKLLKNIFLFSEAKFKIFNSDFFSPNIDFLFKNSTNSSFFQNQSKNILVDEKNFFYLKKWLQIQHFRKIKKNSFSFKFSSNLPNNQKSPRSMKNSSKIDEKYINVSNILNLDFIYFRKILNTPCVEEKKRKRAFETLNQLSNFSLFLKFINKNNIYKTDDLFFKLLKKKNPFSFFLKNRTFEFYIFQHYKNTSNKFINNFLPNIKWNNQQKSKMKSKHFLHFQSNVFNIDKFLKNENLTERKIVKNFKNFSKITCLKIPIYLNFLNIHRFEHSNIYSLQENQLKFSHENIFFKNYFIKKQEDLEVRTNNLSSNYFYLFNNKKIFSKSINLYNSKNFFKSKINYLQTIYEKILTNVKKNKFLFPLKYQLNSITLTNKLLFEKIKNENSLIFNTNKNFFSDTLFPFYSKTKQVLFKSAKFFALNETQNYYVLNKSKRFFCFERNFAKNKTFFQKKQFFKNYFSNFESRKFEKVFKTFLSPLNKENHLNLRNKNKKIQKQNLKKFTFKINKYAKFQGNTFSKYKIFEDHFILQTLSTSLQKKLKNFDFPFFLSFSNKKQIQEKNRTFKTSIFDSKIFPNKRLHNSFQSDFFTHQLKKIQEIKTCKNLKDCNLKQSFSNRTRTRISPSFILKRDGFIFFHFSKPIARIEKETQKNTKFFIHNQIQQMKELDSLTSKRLEREKSIQKKRRMKKQKLETRRRKKRKRFFPRPIWLRFHLYKKFLKTRHSNLFFNFSSFLKNTKNKNIYQKTEGKFSISENLLFQPKIYLFIPKISKYQNIHTFFINKGTCLYFSKMENWKKRMSLSFFSNQEKIIKNSILPEQKKVDKNIQIIFKSLKQNYVLKILKKKKSHVFYFNLFKNNNEFMRNKIYMKKKQNWGCSWKRNNSVRSEKQFYKKFENPMKYSNQTHFFNKFSPVSQNLENYKISSEILSEFIRLSWKSYWFLTNMEPYTKQMTENFRKIQNIESKKNYTDFLALACNKKFLFFQSSPIFQNHYSNALEDLFLRNFVFRKFYWYCNIKNSLEENSVIGNSLNQLNQKSLNFQNIQNISEYNRILYSRVSEILRNFKSFENAEDQSLHNNKNFKFPKHKNEIISSNSSFFTKSALFIENLHIPSKPSIPAFSIFSSIFHDFSIKPTGEIPTLRSLWSLHQTNLYHFQEKNILHYFWTFKKRRDNLKSFQGTKKSIHLLRKYTGLEKLNSQLFLKQDVSKFYVFNEFKKNKQLSEQNKNIFENSLFIKKSHFLIFNNLINKKKQFVSNLKSNFKDFIEQLDILSLEKFLNSQKKCSFFGISTVHQNSKFSLRYLKFQLFSKNAKQNFVWKTNRKKTMNIGSFYRHNDQLENYFKNNDLNQQNSSKSSLNFWWSQNKNQIFDFFMNSQVTRFNSFIFIPSFSLYENLVENFQKSSNNTQQYLKNMNKNKNFYFQTQIFLFGAIIFHLAIFFTILKIPEIRSVLKFQCILYSKFFGGFFFILFSVYNFFKKYTNKGTFVAKKIFSNTSCFFKENNSSEIFTFHLKDSLKLKNSVFSQNIKEENLINLIFFSPYFQKFTFSSKTSFASNILDSPNTEFSLKNKFFEVIFRLSKFSLLFLNNKCLPNSKKYKKFNLFFISIYHFYNFKNYSYFEKTKDLLKISKNNRIILTQKLPTVFFKNSKSIFYFENLLKQFTKKNFKSFNETKNFSNSFHFIQNPFVFSFYNFGQASFVNISSDLKTIFSQSYRNKLLKQRFQSNKNYFLSMTKKNFTFFRKKKLNLDWQHGILGQKNFEEKSSINLEQNFQNFQILLKDKKFVSHLALSFLLFGKSTTILTLSVVELGTNVSSKILDLIENIMFNIYKFLEKPAEVLIEWIALIFLIEWSADIITFVPDTFDIFLAKSFQKFNRPVRSGSFFFHFLNSESSKNILISSPHYGSLFPLNLSNFVGFLSYVNFTSFLFQKSALHFFENFYSIIIQSDVDLLTRQRKGIIFWDIWAEILLKAAEKYNVNIPSFISLKEEQELFIEKLIQNPEFLKNLQTQSKQSPKLHYLKHKFVKFSKNGKLSTKNKNGETLNQNSLKLFIENFIEKERFQEFSEFCPNGRILHKNKQKINNLDISKHIYSPIFEKNLFFLKNQQNFKMNLIKFFKNQKNTKQRYSFENNYENGSIGETHLNSNFQKQKFFILFSQAIWENSFFSESNNFAFGKFDRSLTYEANQSGTYQGPETDLFIDIHPSKSLKHIQFSKYSEPAQYSLGWLICQIYSGLFLKQISKNILLIGSPGTAKTLFIQALAGETEMKMITDNAYRYSTVLRGVAVGMKYLRDIFDALALQTPCFFLMEHIHVLGSKRPFLISDDESIKGMFSNFGLEQQEVHETNQIIYQLSRHSIVDYKRPYKGDFSMGIPTNYFVQNFYSNSENDSNSIFLSSKSTNKNFLHSVGTRNPASPLPIDSIEHSLFMQGFAEKEKTDDAFKNIFHGNQKTNFCFQSRLQISKEQIFAPPATSPFAILMMKEQKKLKPKKVVKENSWGGLSTDQLISYQKESSSIRAKVAILTDITMNLSRGKLDMITDLLVIIDSVRSNRGFVVFATTHLPSLLDPALRRPGRFDETIALAQSPNFLNRFEILKTNFQFSLTTLDFVDSSIFTENLSEINLLNLIMTTKLSFFHQYKYTSFYKSLAAPNLFDFSNKKQKTNFSLLLNNSIQKFNNLQFHNLPTIKKQSKLFYLDKKTPNFDKFQQRLTSQIYPIKSFYTFLKSTFTFDLYSKKFKFNEKYKENLNSEYSKYFLRNLKLLKYTILPKKPSFLLNLAYSKIGIFLVQSNLLKDPTAFTPLSLNISSYFINKAKNNTQFRGKIIYDSQKQQKLQFMIFLSGKIAEFCVQKNTLNFIQNKNSDFYDSYFSFHHKLNDKLKNLNLFQNEVLNQQKISSNRINILNRPFYLFYHKFSLYPKFDWQQEIISSQKVSKDVENNIKSINLIQKQSQLFFLISHVREIGEKERIKLSGHCSNKYNQKTDFYWTTFSNDQIWRFLTPFLFSIIQKRFLFTKNLLLSKMFYFDNKNTRKQPPNPPSSSILMPSKKFENFKRTESDFIQKSRFSINEKIQMHQQQKFLKQLYNVPIQQYYHSEMIENRTTLFSSSFQELGYLDSLTQRFSSSYFYQKKYFIIRHRFSNINQWWNGLLPEYNTETTFLSDVDWRTMFGNERFQKKSSNLLKSSVFINQKINPQVCFEKEKNKTFEFLMDFPDAEQYYNPKNRRWYLNNNFQFFNFSAKSSFLNENTKPHCQKIVLDHKSLKNKFERDYNTNSDYSYWLTFDKTLQYEIYYHYLMQSFHETFYYLNVHREMLDLFVFQLLRKGFLKELDCLMTISQFKNI